MFRTTRKTAVLPLAAAALLLGGAGNAFALPINDDDPPPPPNQAPTAALTVSPNPALVSNPPVLVQAQAARVIDVGGIGVLGRNAVSFDASGSSDPDGSIAKYEWDLDGNGSYEKTTTTPKTSRTYASPGFFTVHVRVTDDGGKKDVAAKALRVHRAPHAEIKATPAEITVGQKTSLLAVGSSDDDGVAKYEWDLDGNGTFETSTATSPVVDAPFATVGTKTVRVKVTDIYNASSVASTTVGVHAAPDAKFSATPAPAVVGEQVQFDGSDSLVNEPVVKFEWDLDGNGTFETNTGANPKATSTYTAPGTVATQLRITDRQGAQDVETRNLTVLAQAPVDRVAPIVRITAPSSRMSKSGRVTLNVTCPAGERLCTGRVALRKAGARSAAVGSRAFRLAGGQRASVRVLLSRSAQRTVKRRGRLAVRITANARDAAGNAGTARRSLTVRKPLR
jgi:PKD repeat protein